MKYIGFVYETTNLVNGMKYIGQCRFDRINGWKNYLGSGTYIKRAIKKYGAENFSRRILFLALSQDELDDLEIQSIEYYKAVESKDYYNLKKTAKGGDTFTHSPNKEKTRLIYQQIRKGKGNSQYGKPKTEKMIQSVKDANSKKVMVNGVVYNSVSECADKLGINTTTLCFRLKSEYQADYLYLDNEGKPVSKNTKSWSHSAKRIIVDGIEYDSMYQYSKKHGVSGSYVKNRVNSDKFPNFKYVEQLNV